MCKSKYIPLLLIVILVIAVFINEIFNIISAIIPAVAIGLLLDIIRKRYQKDEEIIKQKNNQYQERKRKINDLRLNILKNYTSRKMTFENLIYEIENNNKDLSKYREKNREEVLKWNIALRTIHNDLKLLSLSNLSKKYIEDDHNQGNTIQYLFSRSHNLLKLLISNEQNKSNIKKIKNNIEKISKLIHALNNELSSLEEEDNLKIEFISRNNIEKASCIELLKLIFSKNIHGFKIKVS